MHLLLEKYFPAAQQVHCEISHEPLLEVFPLGHLAHEQ